MIRFDYSSPERIGFGSGVIRELPAILEERGIKTCLLVSGTILLPGVQEVLQSARSNFSHLEVPGEPDMEKINEGVRLAREFKCEAVVAIGGGSALDAGKAVAAIANNPGNLLDYLEVVGKGATLKAPSLFLVAIPTTAGTGSEVTRNAVITSWDSKMKVSLRSHWMVPKVALVDPELTYSLSPALTASTGMDALTQVLEPFVCRKANVLTDMYCRAGLARAAAFLEKAFRDGQDVEAREAMSFTSLLGGLALANAGLGAVHGFASPIGGMFPAPHGAVCARLLPRVVEMNVKAMRSREPENPALRGYDEVGRILTGKQDATGQDAACWLLDLAERLAIPPLNKYGISADDYLAIAASAENASSMKTNPIRLTLSEMIEILRLAG